MEFLIILISLIIGIAIGYFAGRRKGVEPMNMDGFVEKGRFEDLTLRLTEQDRAAREVQQILTATAAESAEWRTRFQQLTERISEQRIELERMQEIFKNDFKVLASEVLKETGIEFKRQNHEELDKVIGPFKERLQEFGKKVEDNFQAGQKETHSLKNEVKNLLEHSTRLGKEAENLTRALKGDVKTQGNWGEVILERILERSGLSKGSEYHVQQSHTTDEGRRLQTDVVVELPEGRKIIIDSKVSLVAYERYATAETEEARASAARELVLSVRQHVRSLSDKNYQTLYGIDGLDFVLLFIPIEGAFAAAVQNDHSLVGESFDRNVVIVSTSTLLATLRTIAGIWKQRKQTENAIEIARQAGDLYDKFVGLSQELVQLGKQMRTATATYEESMKKLSDGKGNLVARVERLRELGAKTTKTQDRQMLLRATPDDEELTPDDGASPSVSESNN